MNEKYVYGWYVYRNACRTEFRYPAAKDDDLRVAGRRVTVEIFSGGNWVRRRGIVDVWGGGDYVVMPLSRRVVFPF